MKTAALAPVFAAVVAFAESRGAIVEPHKTLANAVVVKSRTSNLLSHGTLNRIKSDAKAAAPCGVTTMLCLLTVTADEAATFALNHGKEAVTVQTPHAADATLIGRKWSAPDGIVEVIAQIPASGMYRCRRGDGRFQQISPAIVASALATSGV